MTVQGIWMTLAEPKNKPTPMAPPMEISSICRRFKPRVSFV